jgi:peptide/nickel transport system substrate-binding protein
VRTAFKVGFCFVAHKIRMGEIMKVFKKAICYFVLSTLFVLWSWTVVLAAPKGRAIIAVPFDMSVDLFNAKGDRDRLGLYQIYSTLTTPNMAGTDRVPYLAKSWKLGNKGKSIELILDERARFSNGDPVTCHDVKFSWQKWQAGKGPFRSVSRKVNDVQINSDTNCVLHLKRPDADWKWEIMRMQVASKNYFEKAGKKQFAKKPLGSGPYRFVKRIPGTSFEMEAVENHWFHTPDFKTTKFMVVPDPVTRMALLEKGTVDMTFPVDPFHIARLEKSSKIQVKTASVPSLNALGFNSFRYDVMADKNLRLAINYAIDRQEICDEIFFGKCYPMYYFTSKAEVGFDPSIKYEFDPDKARELVKKSSYKAGAPVKLVYSSGLPSGNLVTTAVQDYLKKVGITVKLQKMERATYMKLAARKDSKIGELPVINWSGGKSPTSRLFLGLMTKGKKGAAGMYTNWKGRKQIDKLILFQSVQINEKKRVGVLRKIAGMTHQDPAYAALFGLPMIYALSDRVDYDWPENVSGQPFNLYTIKRLK